VLRARVKRAENFPDAPRKLEKKGFGQDTFYDDVQVSEEDLYAQEQNFNYTSSLVTARSTS
jgi:hypothetical protein